MKKALFTVLLVMPVAFSNCDTNESPNSTDNKEGITHTDWEKNVRKDLSKDSVETTESLQLSCNRYDFGIVSKRKVKNIQFNIEMKNVGTKPIAIQKVDASCGCLSASFDKKPIPPAQTAQLAVNVNTRNLKGQFSKVLFINSTAEEGIKLVRIVGKITD